MADEKVYREIDVYTAGRETGLIGPAGLIRRVLSWSRRLSKLRSTWLLRKRIRPVSPVFCSLAALLYLYPLGYSCPFCPLSCSRYGFAQGARSIYHRLQKKQTEEGTSVCLILYS